MPMNIITVIKAPMRMASAHPMFPRKVIFFAIALKTPQRVPPAPIHISKSSSFCVNLRKRFEFCCVEI